jgi:hypothetical protein
LSSVGTNGELLCLFTYSAVLALRCIMITQPTKLLPSLVFV